MRCHVYQLFSCLALPALCVALPAPETVAAELKGKRSFEERDGVKRTIFEHEATGATLSFVTNSGICETTPGVNQYSGYLSVGSKFYLPVSSSTFKMGMQAMRICGFGSLRLGTTPLPLPWLLGSTVVQGARP